MQDAHAFLKALTIVLGVAAVTTVVFQRLRQPVVLGYIIAGLIVGPHVPIPLVADSAVVRTLSELGVILLCSRSGSSSASASWRRSAPRPASPQSCNPASWCGWDTWWDSSLGGPRWESLF